jgi:hypothetical protein
MNICMQTRRAVITLSLAAVAMACIVAKTSQGADAQARSPIDAQRGVATISLLKEMVATPSVAAPVRLVRPMLVTKERFVRKTSRTRCEGLPDA